MQMVRYRLLLRTGETIDSIMPLEVMKEIIRRAKTIEDYYGTGHTLVDKDVIIPNGLYKMLTAE